MTAPERPAIEQLPGAERAAAVRSMFGAIAHGYDRTNSVLSGGVHHLWRRRAVRELGLGVGERVLDCCCGTGDLALAFARTGAEVVGTDFTPEMIELARRKPGADRVTFEVADATDLPFEGGRFDAATVSFGIRNVADPVRGLREMARCVRPGGRVLVLEFGQPRGPLGWAYRFYSRHLMPRIGGWLTGQRAAYEYLPRTSAAFPAGARFEAELLVPAGLVPLRRIPLSFGIAWIYVGEVPQEGA